MSVLRFGEFELDEQTLGLRKNGESLRIQQQPARVLAFLVSHRGELVTREHIRLAIWGETFVDFEQGLNFCIRQIRLTLEDRADKPRYIETLPRLGYRFLAAVESETPSPAKRPETSRLRIGVVPIENLSPADDDYFAAGLTEDMISTLSRIDPARLRIVAIPRLVGAASQSDQLDRLQKSFNLDYLLRGSVRRSGDTFRVTAQLHDLKDRSVLWSETFDRKSADLLAVQEDVTGRVSQSLALELLPGAAAGARKYSRSTAAYDAYLKGRFFWHRMTPGSIHNSLRYFNEALLIDPAFAPAHAGLADCYAQMGSVRIGLLQPLDALAKARPHLQRAFELDDTLAEAHCTLGLIKIWYDLDWAGAEREFQTALSLDPSHITALVWQSLYLAAVGRHREAVESVRRAKESEPLSVGVNVYLGVILSFAGDIDLALRQLHLAAELDPGYYRSYLFLGVALIRAERYEEAIGALEAALVRNPENIEALAYLACAAAEMGDRARALEIVERLEAAQSTMEPSILLAVVFAHLRNADEMFHWLRIAVERRSTPIYLPLVDTTFAPYRSDPRYRSFLESIGLAHLVAGTLRTRA